MGTQHLSAMLAKLSNLLIQESDLLLGVETYIEMIEYLLRSDYLKHADQGKSRKLIHNIEDTISDLIISSDKICKRYAFLQYCMSFGHMSKATFFVMIAMQLFEYNKMVQKLWHIYNQILDELPYGPCQELSGSIEDRNNGLSLKNTVIFGAITQCEALASEQQLSGPIKRHALWLCDKFKSFQAFLKDVEIDKLRREEMWWIDEVFDVCSSTNDTISSFLCSMQHQHKKKGPLHDLILVVPKLVSQQKLAKQLLQIKDYVQNIADTKPQLISAPIALSNNVRSLTLASAEQLDIVSFDEDLDAIISKLLVEDSRCITVSIVGVAGIGKTSLAKLVYTNNAIIHQFPLRLWVSGTSDIETVEKLFGVGGYLNNRQLFTMANTVYADKRFLVVVDNSCAGIFWTKMERIFRNLFNGSRIIFTCHKPKEAPPISDTNFNYRLHLRSDDESWALFMHTVKINMSSQLEKDLKRKILRKCGGLPKVIVKLAGTLSHKEATLDEWSRVLERLNQDEEPWRQMEKDINKFLPVYYRRCLFYFGLFPEDYKIPARRLINLWIAEGLLCGKDGEISVERVAEKCLEDLANFDMVQVTERKLNGKIKTCYLPEALRQHWLAKAKETNFLQGHSNINTGVRRVANHLNPNDAIFHHIHGNNYTNLYLYYRNSVTFLSFDGREEAGLDISKFLGRCISANCFLLLLVLDLETVYRPKLPKALGKLTRLRYLGLCSTYLERLPMFIDKLLSLQTLDLKRTCINTLPRSIWKMQKLRNLFLDQSFRTILLPRLEESSLEGLRTLWGVFVDENSPVKNGLETMPRVSKLGLKSKLSMASRKDAMTVQLKAVEDWVMNLKCLKKLRLKSFDELEQPWDLHLDSLSEHKDLSSAYLVGNLKNQQLVSKFPQNLVELTLSASGLVTDPTQELEKLPNLKLLGLIRKSFLGERMHCSRGGFPKLQVFKLWELEQLEEWDIEEGSLPLLKHLEIRRCMNLKMLPEGLKAVKTLRIVKLTQLPLLSPKLKDINGDDRNKIAHVLNVYIED